MKKSPFGDYILSGSEILEMVLIDSIARLLPNALNTPESILFMMVY